MQTMKTIGILIILLAAVTTTFAQNRVQPGRLYQSGEEIISPKFGFRAMIPEGWSGFLPQGTEVFALNKNNGTSSQVLVFGRENSDLSTLKAAWREGMDLSSAIHVKADEITGEGDMIYADIVTEGKSVDRNNKGAIIGRCGPYGTCITLFLAAPVDYYDQIREEMMRLMQSGTFSEPGDADIYVHFDWKKFLSNKILVAFELQELSRRQNQVDLCADGTFSSVVRQTGWFNQGDTSYKGKNTGTWSVSTIGPQTTLTLNFNDKKLSAIEIELKIEDEKIFANGRRYYAGYSEKCN